MPKSAAAFRTIGEAAEDLDVPQHVLRYWETRFPQIKPMKSGGGRRYYRPEDMALLASIRGWLYGEGYTIGGVQRLLKENGARPERVATAPTKAPAPPPPAAAEPRIAVVDPLASLRAAIDLLAEARGLLARARAFSGETDDA